MKHYIIAKLKEGVDKYALVDPVTKIFKKTLAIPGIHGVKVKPCCIDRPNRYDLMIEIEMDKEALPAAKPLQLTPEDVSHEHGRGVLHVVAASVQQRVHRERGTVVQDAAVWAPGHRSAVGAV